MRLMNWVNVVFRNVTGWEQLVPEELSSCGLLEIPVVTALMGC